MASAEARRPNKALTLAALGALGPRKAAAYFIARRSEGLTTSEQDLLEDWLAADASHRRALARAEYAWRVFDEPCDSKVLSAIREQALAPRSRTGSGRRLAVGAAAVIALVAGIVLASLISGE